MRSGLWSRALALAGAALIISATGVLADNVVADGDNATPIAANPLALGTVCVNATAPAASVTENVLLGITRNGNYSTAQVFKDGTTVTFSVDSVTGTGLSAAVVSASFTVPSDWDQATNNDVAGQATSKVTFTAGSAAGPFTGSVTYKATGTQAKDGSTLTRTGTLPVTATVSSTGACAPAPSDTTPPTVTVSFPAPVSGLNGWFNANDIVPVVGSVTASDASNVTDISCTGATLTGVTGYGTTSASGTLTVSGDGTHNVSCEATDGASPANTGAAAGSSNTATIKIDATPPVIADAGLDSGTAGDHGWYVSAVTEDFTASDATSGLADCAASFTKGSGTTEGPAVTIGSGPCSDNAGNTNAGIDSAAYMIDTTAPSVVYTSAAPAPNAHGWNDTDVVATFTATDNVSGFDASRTPTTTGTTTTSGQGTAVTVGSPAFTDWAGNTAAAGTATSDPFKIDMTAPSVVYTSAAPAPNAYGWNNTDVVATFTATDDLSGFDAIGTLTATGTSTTSGEGTAVTVGSPAFTDWAGNTAATGTATSDPFKIDETAPVTSVTGVADGATYTLGSVPAAGCSDSDSLSGVLTASTLGTSGGPVGSVTATCSGAVDYAGNPGNSASATYTVVYSWTGFFQPVDNLPLWNSAKAGSAIPVKFNLGGNQGLNIFKTGYPRITATTCPNAATAVDPIDYYLTNTAGGSSLTYDTTAQQYVYAWKTDKTWAGKCFSFNLGLNDGTSRTFQVQFTK